MHFYGYGERSWRWLDSALNPQTRLCVADYRRIFGEMELRVVREESERRSAEELAGIRLAPRFQKYAAEDLRAFSTWMTLHAD